MTYNPIQPVQGITPPLALRDSGDRDRFNEAAENNLRDMKALADGLNADFIPKVNQVAESVDPILRNMTAVLSTATHIQSVLNVDARLDDIAAVNENLTDIGTVAQNAANVQTVAEVAETLVRVDQGLEDIGNAVLNMTAITEAPAYAQAAQDAAAQSQQSAEASQSSATQSEQSAQASSESETTSLAVENNVITIQQAIQQMYEVLLVGGTPEAAPHAPILRDGTAQAKIADPTEDLHIANRQFVIQAIDTAISSLSGGLKTPEIISLESELPDAATAENGTFFVVDNMDVTQPGFQGRAWKNAAVSETQWIVIVDRMQTADGANIVLDSNGFLNLSQDIQTILARVDTTGSVQAAINAGLWQNAARYTGTAAPATALGVNGDIYFMYV